MSKHIYFTVLLFMASLGLQAQKSFQVEKSGAGQPILLFPGFTSTSQVFEGITEVLEKEYEVHAFTFAGFGEVPPIKFPWLPRIKEDIEAYITENDLENPVVIGHSLGGTLGLWLASEKQDYSAIIVIDALPAMGAMMIPDYDSDEIVYESAYNEQLLAMEESAFRGMAQQMAATMSVNKEYHQQLADWMVESDRQTYVYGYTDLLKLDLREELGKIGSKVTILAATHPYGKEVAEANYWQQYANLTDYTLKFAEGAGHFIMYDQPQWLLDQIQTVLNTNE